jgi:hypothetical protein
MKVTNPTKEKLTVQINGVFYSVDGESSVIVPKEVAVLWANKIHQFLTLEEVKTEEVVEVKEEEVAPVVEI